MTDPVTRLHAALEGRYRVERQLGEGGTWAAARYIPQGIRYPRLIPLDTGRFLPDTEIGTVSSRLPRPTSVPIVGSSWTRRLFALGSSSPCSMRLAPQSASTPNST